MHEIRTYDTAAEYWEDVGPSLLQNEPLHSLGIGLARRWVENGWSPRDEAGGAGALLGSVWKPDGSFEFAVWCTPPYAPTVTGGSREGLSALVEHVQGRGGTFTRCNGPLKSMEHLAEVMARPSATGLETILHRLDELVRPSDPPKIQVMLATPSDEELLLRWTHRFAIDCGLAREGSDPPEAAVVRNKGRYFLAKNESGELVSMAAISRETPKSASLSYVYTPPQHRGHGYASALVAEVTQFAMDGGKSYCTLFTDRANPTSNKIYRALGYHPIGEFREVTFEGE